MTDFTNIITEKAAITEIDKNNRLRNVNPEQVDFIAESIFAVGLHCPIILAKNPQGTLHLVAGGHRLAAAEQLGWSEIEAKIYEGLSVDEARLIEIDENLCRNELNQLDRAVFMGERKKAYEALIPQTKNGGDRRSDEFQNDTMTFCSFSESTADAVGIGKRTVERAIRIYEKICPAHRKKISGTWLANNAKELYELTKYDVAEQAPVITLLLDENNQHKTVKSAHIYISDSTLEEINPDEQLYNKLLNLYGRAPASVQQKFMKRVEAEALGGAA